MDKLEFQTEEDQKKLDKAYNSLDKEKDERQRLEQEFLKIKEEVKVCQNLKTQKRD